MINFKNCVIFWTFVVCFAPTVQAFWGDDVVPRLRVNYLSQSSGKNQNQIYYYYFLNLQGVQNGFGGFLNLILDKI